MMCKARTPWTIAAGLAALAVILLVAAGCANVPAKLTPAALQTPPGSSARTKPLPPIEVELNMRGRPTLGATVQVDLLVKLLADAPSTVVTLTLPAGSIELAGGKTVWQSVQRAENPATGAVQHAVWQGSPPKGEATVLPTALRITRNGYHQIHAYAYIDLGIGGRYGNFADLYLLVDGAEAWVGKQPPKNNWVANNVSPGGLPVPPGTERLIARACLTRPLEWNQETDLIYEITPTADIEKVEIGLILPQAGIAVVKQGNPRQETLVFRPAAEREILGTKVGSVMRWVGPLVEDDKTVTRVSLKPTTTGEGAIIVYVSELRSGGAVLLHKEILHLSVYRPDMAE
jgi:hypothetical protein